MSTAQAPATQDARSLLTVEEFSSVVATVMDSNPDMTERLAGRIVEQGLAFVATCARFPRARIAPSPVIDEGWHALILHTALYARLCNALGRFVHHYPQRPEPSGYDPTITQRTLDMLAGAGYEPDMELWQGPADNQIAVAAQTWHTPPGGCGPIVLIPKKPKPDKPSDT